MNAALRATAATIQAAMPCSVELPAGVGKTQLVAALAVLAAEQSERPLILTHTNAGVDVMRRRLKRFGVSGNAVRIDTIASWSCDLIRHYPRLSGVATGEEPDWARSREYYGGAAAAIRTSAIGRVLTASHRLVIVDEYQDCITEQHDLIVGLGELLPVCVFGDRLQNIFSFGDNVTVSWSTDILPRWPAVPVPVTPWRWDGHNEPLGQWLIDIRPRLLAGEPIDLVGAPLTWQSSSGTPQATINACYGLADADGSVVAIGQFPQDCAYVATRTNGIYGVMEELEGSFMAAFADTVDGGQGPRISAATCKFAKACISGVASKLNDAVVQKLARGESVTNLRRPGAERQLELLTGLLTDASPGHVAETLQAIGQLPDGKLYRREAWRDTIAALKVADASDSVSVSQALGRLRNRTRILGRSSEARVISRPLLIKGLEYDHAVVLNAERFSGTELYVALSRARKTLTIVSGSRYLAPGAPEL
jgi:hypothetical protein